MRSTTKTIVPRGPAAKHAAGMGADEVPAVGAPKVPKDHSAGDARDFLGARPRLNEVRLAGEVVEDFQRFTDYEKVFGSMVPSAAQLASVLEFASRWRMERDAADAWSLYVHDQDARAWKTALDWLDELKPAFLLALKRGPRLSRNHPRLVAFFEARKEIAKRATATKLKKKQKADASGSKAAPASVVQRGKKPRA